MKPLCSVLQFATYLMFLKPKYFLVSSVFKRFYLGRPLSFCQVKGPVSHPYETAIRYYVSVSVLFTSDASRTNANLTHNYSLQKQCYSSLVNVSHSNLETRNSFDILKIYSHFQERTHVFYNDHSVTGVQGTDKCLFWERNGAFNDDV